jgi:hypothetical protein
MMIWVVCWVDADRDREKWPAVVQGAMRSHDDIQFCILCHIVHISEAKTAARLARMLRNPTHVTQHAHGVPFNLGLGSTVHCKTPSGPSRLQMTNPFAE